MNTSLYVETKIFDARDPSTPIRTLCKEIDVNPHEAFSRSESEAIAVGKEFHTTLLREIVKKKKRFWLPYLWRTIRNWYGGEKFPSRYEGLRTLPPTQGND
jgi:hypothetical protein